MRKYLARRRPSPAMAVAFVALLAALSGTAVALPGKNTVDSGDLKRNSVKNADIARGAVSTTKLRNGAVSTAKIRNDAVTGAKVNEGSLGQVPSAANAANAATAANANALQGRAASSFASTTLASGQTTTGHWAVAGPGTYAATGLTFVPRLPAPLDGAHVIYVTGASAANCPGIGQANPGYLCVYQGQAAGMTFQSIGNGQGDPGAAVDGADLFMTAGAVGAYASGTWAVTAP